MQTGFTRFATYDIDYIFDKLGDNIFSTKNRKRVMLDDGNVVKANSQRIKLFKLKGCKCVRCGIEGKFFAYEGTNKKEAHLNLYAIDKNGNEVLMTKDHILPKSRGGANQMTNYVTMCSICNFAKGNRLESEL